ncbi:P-loop NTPase fold protein [Pseudomonas guariconensis]|uniref:P-loop NTPase fold protein n=1 Tax=Pseudomonas guariconensis TaxID=1288410 RepID=UPI00336BF6BD
MSEHLDLLRGKPQGNPLQINNLCDFQVTHRLRRAGYAVRIAGVLSELSPREGRVFAIRGGWGFGKSSLKYLVIEQLSARINGNQVHWLDFNPWQWGDGTAITRALFGQIADQLGGDHSQEAIERAEALRRYGAILSGASAPLKSASGASQKISCGFHAIRPPSPLSSGQAFHGHLATCSTAIRPGSRSAATQGGHC